MKNKYLIPVVIYVSVIGDAFRDRFMSDIYRWTEPQWWWHIAKWGSMFSLWGLLTWLWFKSVGVNSKTLALWAVFTIICNVTWNLIY